MSTRPPPRSVYRAQPRIDIGVTPASGCMASYLDRKIRSRRDILGVLFSASEKSLGKRRINSISRTSGGVHRMNATNNQARAIFLEAIELQAHDDRSSFLERACAGDLELRARVEQLLRSHEALGTFHDDRGRGSATIHLPVTERPGTII